MLTNLRILHICNKFSGSGSGNAASSIANSLSNFCNQSFYHNDFCSPPDNSNINFISTSKTFKVTSRLLSKSTQFCLKPFSGYANYSLPYGLSRLKFVENNFDLVHMHWSRCFFIDYFSFMRLKTPKVIHLHDYWPLSGLMHYDPYPYSNTFSLLDKSVFEKKFNLSIANNLKFVAPSPASYQVFQNSPYSEYFDCIHIPNPISFSSIDLCLNRKPQTSIESLNSHKYKICFSTSVNQFDPRKGFDLLLKAIHLLYKSYPSSFLSDLQFVLIGISRSSIDLPASADVICLPKLSFEHAITLYSLADLGLIPSRKETFGLTALEYLYCNTPILVMDGSGIQSFIKYSKGSSVFNHECPIDLSKKIYRSYVFWKSNLSQYKNIDITSIVNDFSEASVSRQILDLYLSILK